MVSALVIGNVTVDEIYSVDCLPKSGNSVLGQLLLSDIGGKGANVAMLLARCGVHTQFTALVGDDDRGRLIRDGLANESLAEGLVVDMEVSPNTTTDVSLVYTDSRGDSSIVTTVDAAHSLNWRTAEKSLAKMKKRDMVFLQANLTEALTRRIVQHAKKTGLTVIFNPSPCALWVKSIVEDVDILFLNATESQALTGASNKAAVRALLELGPQYVVLTLGEHGALFGSACSARRGTEKIEAKGDTGDAIISLPAVAVDVDVKDTTGAGDTYLAVAMASARLRGELLDTIALRHGASAAAITVRSHGTRSAFPTATQLGDILDT